MRKVLYTNTAFDSRLKQLARFMIWGMFGIRVILCHSEVRPEKETFWARPSVCRSVCNINSLSVLFGGPFFGHEAISH